MSKLIKVCGMRDPANIKAVAEFSPDFMGFIFYPKSPRYVGEDFVLPALPTHIQKMGVFVNESLDKLLQISQKYSLDYVQLHGGESPEYCIEIKKQGLKILKAFSIDSDFDFGSLKPFEGLADYFLFDTKGDGYGGHGKTFDWKLLEKYNFSTPFLIAGGVSNFNIGVIKKLSYPMLKGVDVNSKYEISPALKDTQALEELFLAVRSE